MTDLLLHASIMLFVVLDPIGLVPIFAGLTHGGGPAYRRRMAIKGTTVAGAVLIVFVFAGEPVLRYLGIGMPAFRIAGGALLFLLAIDMVFARQSGLRSTTHSERAEAEHKADISVFPLGIPLIAGPGAMTTMLLLVGRAEGDAVVQLALLAVLLAVLALTCLMLLAAGRMMRLLGETGANVVSRVLGVVLAALAVQFVLDGLVATPLLS